MKRIVRFSFLFVFFVFSQYTVAQVFNFTATPSVLCYTNSVPGPYTTEAAQVVGSPAATNYNWLVIGPIGCTPTWTNGPGNGSMTTISFPCCGTYTITHFAFCAGAPAPCNQVSQEFTVVCPTGASISITNGTNVSNSNVDTVCAGSLSNLSLAGVVSANWISKSGNSPTLTAGAAPAIPVSPTANTNYTVVGITANGCVVTGTAALVVSSATVGINPVTLTRCQGAPITFTASSGVQTGSLYASGTATTGIQWFEPGACSTCSFANTTVATTTATAGTYQAVLTYTGLAGTCTAQALANVLITNTIQVNAGPNTPSVCPGAPVTLTANVTATPQTSSSNYSWTAQVGANPPTTFTGSSAVQNPTTLTNYTVNVTYYGCTGTATTSVAKKSLTVNIASSSPSICPNSAVNFSVSGGLSYTYTAYYANNPTNPVVLVVSPTVTTVSLMPSKAQLCATLVVDSQGGGCTGSSSITVCEHSLNAQLIPSSPSVCPNSTVCLYNSNGCGTSNTITCITTTITNTTTNNCTSSASVACFSTPATAIIYPLTFVSTSDSAGCVSSTTLNIDKMTLVPTLTPTSYSICPSKSLTLSALGGAGTNFTFTAPYNYPPPSSTTTVIYSGPNNTTVVFTPTPSGLPYTYTVEADSAGCVGSTTVQIGLLTLTPPFSANQSSVCPSSPITLTANAGSGATYTFSSSYTIITTASNTVNTASLSAPSNSLLLPQVYTVSVDSAGCVGTVTTQVGLLNLSSNITLSVNPAVNNSVCPGNNFTLTSLYNGGSTGVSFTFQALPTGSPLPTGSANNEAVTSTTNFPADYRVFADSAQCLGTQTISVKRMVLKNLNIVATPPLVCSGQPATLTASGVGTGTNVTFVFGTLTPMQGTTFPTPTPTLLVNPTVQTVYAVVADSSGCVSDTTLLGLPTTTIGIIPGLTLTASASQQSVCAGLPTTLSVVGSGTTNITYTWSPSGASNFGTLTPGPAPSQSAVAEPTANVTFTVEGSDSLGCKGTTTISVGIDPLAMISVSISAPISTVCPGLSTTLTATSNINPVTFAWSPTLGLNPTNSATVTASPSLTTVYTATASNGWGCTGTANYTVIVNSYPNLQVTPTASAVCPGYTSTLTAFGANGYTWTSASFSNAVAQQSVSVGPGTYTVVGSNGGGCLDTAYISIGNAPPLNITVSQSSQTTCIENNSPKYSQPVTLAASGANTYVWFPYNPIHMTYSLGPTTVVRPPASTCYTVTGGTSICSGSAIVCVTVIPQFSMNVVPPLPYICLGDSLKLDIVNISTLAVGPVSAFSYSWTEALNAPPISISSKFTRTVTVFPQNTTTYSVQVKDSRSCVSLPKLVTVTVLPRPITAVAIPTINNIPTNTLCFVGLNPGPDDVVLTLIAANKNTNLQFGVVPTFTWVSPYPSKYNSILTPVNDPGITVNAPLRAPGIVTYTLLSGYNGVQGCRRLDTVSVRVIDCRPVIKVYFNTAEKLDTICAQTCITFVNETDTAAGGPQTFTWTFKGGAPATSNSSIQTVCYNLPGKYDVILTVSNPYPKTPPNSAVPGSTNLAAGVSYVKVVNIPNVTIFSPGQIRSDTVIRVGTPIVVKGNGALYYEWSPNHRIFPALNDASVTLLPLKNTQYILTGRNSKDCFSSDTLNVMVVDDCGEMYVPNAFTPNGDGANDTLFVRGICLKTLTFLVFNRWGEKVFETNDQHVGWDGKFKGEILNTGVFVFRLEGRTYDGKTYSLKGNVTLIR